jgi:hypothetical protein
VAIAVSLEEMGLNQIPSLAADLPPSQTGGAGGPAVLEGGLTMAQVVEWLTVGQVRYQMGALPVLYALLETLKVRQVINRHCPSQAGVDHGTVALVLVLNH